VDILDDMGVSKLSAKVFFLKVNYSFNYKNPANKTQGFGPAAIHVALPI